MDETLRCVGEDSLIAGWDFSTGGVKCLAFDLTGHVVAEVRLPTDLWTEGGVSELNLMQLEGQVRASTRALAAELMQAGRADDWVAGGVSATHHTAGRIDAHGNQVRRAVCWNDQTLAEYHAEGLARLGGPQRPVELTGGPWAIRYSLTHLVKDEKTLPPGKWRQTSRILTHGSLAAGYLTGRFDVASVSTAASTGLMDLRTSAWRREMLDALESEEFRERAWTDLPQIMTDECEPVGPLSRPLAWEAGLAGPGDEDGQALPLVFPTLDDQAAGLVGGGAVDGGQVAIILGNSAVVNSSSDTLPRTQDLDAMKLNWGPYLWMRCYNNGAQFLDRAVGPNPDWDELEAAAREVPPGCGGVRVLPFALTEPSLGVAEAGVRWPAGEPEEGGVRFRAALEALAYMAALGVRAHQAAGQDDISDITVSGGIARSDLMCEILASVLGRPLKRLRSSEGPALGAAVAALAGLETYRRRRERIAEPYTVAAAVQRLVRFRDPVEPNREWVTPYQDQVRQFESDLPRA